MELFQNNDEASSFRLLGSGSGLASGSGQGPRAGYTLDDWIFNTLFCSSGG